MNFVRSLKYRLILRPFLVVSLGCGLFMVVLQIILLRQYGVLPFWEDWLRLTPLLLPWIPLAVWLFPGLRRLHYPNWTRGIYGYYVLSALLIAVPLMIVQAYLPQVAGKRVELENVRDVPRFASARYFRLGHFYSNAKLLSQYFVSRVSGRGSGTLELHQYVLVPMYSDSLARTVSVTPDPDATIINPFYYTPEERKSFLHDNPPVAWACLHAQQSMNNQALYVDKLERWNHFQQERLAVMQTRYWDTVTEWEQVPNDFKRRNFIQLIPGSIGDQHKPLLMPRNNPIVPRPNIYIGWILFSFWGGFLIFWFITRVTPIRE